MKSLYGFNTSQAVPYPGKLTVIREAGVVLVATGPVLALVAASIVNRLPELNLPRLDKSTTTVRGAPLPLLSLAY